MAYNAPYLACLLASFLAIAGSQLLTKWRFEVLGFGELGNPFAALRLAIFDPWLWCAGFLIVGSAGLWYTAMTRLPLSFMMPLAAIIAPTVALGAVIFFSEPISPAKIMAIATIAAGVAWLGWLQ